MNEDKLIQTVELILSLITKSKYDELVSLSKGKHLQAVTY